MIIFLFAQRSGELWRLLLKAGKWQRGFVETLASVTATE